MCHPVLRSPDPESVGRVEIGWVRCIFISAGSRPRFGYNEPQTGTAFVEDVPVRFWCEDCVQGFSSRVQCAGALRGSHGARSRGGVLGASEAARLPTSLPSAQAPGGLSCSAGGVWVARCFRFLLCTCAGRFSDLGPRCGLLVTVSCCAATGVGLHPSYMDLLVPSPPPTSDRGPFLPPGTFLTA